MTARFTESLAVYNAGDNLAAEYVMPAGQLVFTQILGAFESSDAQRLLAVVDAAGQEGLLSQARMLGVTKPITPLPVPASQSRAYLADLNRAAGPVASSHRIALWESTATESGAGELNEKYASRFGEPMEPAAWAAYQAARIIVRVAASGGTDTDRMIQWLENPSNQFDVAKGEPAAFRAWDHQLRQPLHVIQLDPDARWGNLLSDKNSIASSIGLLSSSSE